MPLCRMNDVEWGTVTRRLTATYWVVWDAFDGDCRDLRLLSFGHSCDHNECSETSCDRAVVTDISTLERFRGTCFKRVF